MKKLSIIVPVYNVEEYIRPCIESIFCQNMTEADFEVILINDGTQDNSLGIIEDLIEQHTNILVIEQANQGLSVARNTGLIQAKGEYILFVDSDDLLVPDSVAPLLHLVRDSSSDLLIADFVKLNNQEILKYKPSHKSEIRTETKTGSELFQNDLDPNQCYVWRTIYRREFLIRNELRFIPGIYFEDIPFTTQCYLKARQCIRVWQTLYIYRQRKGSICSDITTRKVLDFNKVITCLWSMLQDISLTEQEQRQLMHTIFTTFSIEIWYISHNRHVLAERDTIINDLRQRVPDLHFTGGLKQRLISFLYHYLPSTYIRMRAL